MHNGRAVYRSAALQWVFVTTFLAASVTKVVGQNNAPIISITERQSSEVGAHAQGPSAGPSAGDIYRKSSAAVVLIELYNDKGEVAASGSGFLISSDGRILTNYHVIAHSKQATVRLANKDAYDSVYVLEIDKRKDIALLKINAVDLPYLSLGKSSTVDIGDKVFSVSTPLGILQNTLSEGIVSGIRLGDGYRYFQVSAPISHGSSGGPIFNSAGEVIGIAAATIEEGQNLNFAVPIDYAKGMLTANQPRTMASVYEPEPVADKSTAPSSAGTPANASSSVTPSSAIPEEMKKSSLIYLEGKLGTWTLGDATKELGQSISYRPGPTDPTLDIFGFDDPTRQFRKIELLFPKKTLKLTNIFAYPMQLTWDECKRTWGDKVSTIKYPDGSKLYGYRDRRLSVLVDKHGDVTSLGVY
jgi:hypothetical protein